jgi:hypothetical protein
VWFVAKSEKLAWLLWLLWKCCPSEQSEVLNHVICTAN